MADAAGVDELEVETGRVAQFLHRRRGDREDQAVAILREGAHRAADDRLGDIGAALALRPVLQRHEGEAAVLAGAGEAEAVDREHALHVAAFLCRKCSRIRSSLFGARRGGAAGPWTRAIMMPWSSSGRKPLGRRRNKRLMPPTISR
jgi:hypothetical protein